MRPMRRCAGQTVNRVRVGSQALGTGHQGLCRRGRTSAPPVLEDRPEASEHVNPLTAQARNVTLAVGEDDERATSLECQL